jgi:rRNA maturation RNase YbeY
VSSELESRLLLWFPKACALRNVISANLEVIWCTDHELLQINRQALNHDYYTDIITFPLEIPEVDCSGELYISTDRITENAESFSNGQFDLELVRVVAHGFLHLLGLNDKTEEESKSMRGAEAELIKLW